VPLERVVEFRIAAPVDALPDLIFYLGKTGIAMFEERPQRLARPRDPEIQQGIRKLDEILSIFSQYYQPNIVTLPREPLARLLDRALNEIAPLFEETKKYAQELQVLRQKLQLSTALSQLRNYRFPKTDALDNFIVIPGKYTQELINLSRDLGAAFISIGDVAILSIAKEKSKLLVSALSKLGLEPLRPEDLANLDDPDHLRSKIDNLYNQIRDKIYNYRNSIDFIYTLRYTLSIIIDTFNKSAISEGEETGHLFTSLSTEIERLKSEFHTLSTIKEVLAELKTSGTDKIKLPDGLALYAEVEEGGAAAKIAVGNREVYLARDGLRGIKIPRQYLDDITSSLKVVEETLNSIERSLRNRESELKSLEEIYREYSVYGDGDWQAHKDIGTVIFYVKEGDVGAVDAALTELVKALSVKLDIVRNIRYKYFQNVPARRRPTLERFPTPVRQIVNKIAYMYGVPSASEISPSALVAVLFPIFFGWMFGDLGHGLLLFLFGLWLYKSLFGGKYKDWGVVWMVTGVFSMFFGGVVYGEFFGFPLSYFGVGWDGLIHMFQPVVGPQMGTAVETEGIFADLLAALLFGYIIMAGSFSLKIANFVLEGEKDMALGIGIPILLIYVSAGMIVLALLKPILPMPPLMADALNLPWIYILIAAIVLLVAGATALTAKYRGHEEKPPIGLEMAVGLVEGVFGGLANVPSFARLMVLILMHGIFTKLSMGWALALAESGNVAGAVVIAVLFNILIAVGEGFMSLIQSLRLTFYETLSKFYEGRGRLFTPLVLP
jgi:V/A-type H+-transporting ATPase subunit I